MPSEATGRTRWRAMSSSRSIPVLPEAIVSMPPAGSQRRSTAKMTISTRPSQKPGMA